MIYNVQTAQGLRVMCKGLFGTQYPMENGQLWQFENIRMIVHHVENGEPKTQIHHVVNIDNDVTIGAMLNGIWNLKGVEMEAHFIDTETKGDYYRELEPFLMKIGMRTP